MSKIDRLVAIKIMRMKSRTVRAKALTQVVEVWDNNPALVDGVFDAGVLMLHGCPPFSCDMEEAWNKVVHRMRKRGFTISLTNKNRTNTAYFYRWPSGKRPDHKSRATRQASYLDAPLAICVAALRAVGVSDTEIQEALT